MAKKSKKLSIMLSTLTGAIISSSVAGIVLSSCTTTSNNSGSSSQNYISIDWNNIRQVNNLVKDDQGLVYSDSTKTTIIAISPKSNVSSVTIPASVKVISGYYNKTSGSNNSYTGAFANNTSLITLNVEYNSQLTSISEKAFYQCTNLKEVNLTNANLLETIGYQAFYNNVYLTNVLLPPIDKSNLKMIGKEAFYACSSLVNVGPENTTGFISPKLLNNYSASSDSIIQTGGIGGYAFSGTAIETIDLSNSLSTTSPFEPYSFSNMSYLKSIDFGDNTSIEALPNYLFSDDTNLTEIVLPSSIKEISSGLFYKSKLTTIDMSKIQSYSKEVGKENEVPYRLFSELTSLKSVTLKSNTTSIGSYAFNGTTSLIYIFDPDNPVSYSYMQGGFAPSSNLKNIDEGAFYGAFSNTPIIINNSEKYYDISVNLSKASFKDNLIKSSTFSESNISSLLLPYSVTTIEYSAFKNLSKLVSLSVALNGEESYLTTIERNNFTNLSTTGTEIDLSRTNLKSIDSDSFIGLNSYSQVILPSTFVLDSSSNIFKDTNNKTVSISYGEINPSVINEYIKDNVLSGDNTTSISTNVFSNYSYLDLSEYSDIVSIGPNTFYGPKIQNLDLSAKNITKNSNLFLGKNLSVNTNIEQLPLSYKTNNVPFGYYNKNFLESSTIRNLTYNNFPINKLNNSSDNPLLYTNQSTWDAISTLLNSFVFFEPSYFLQQDSNEERLDYPANLSVWEKKQFNYVASSNITRVSEYGINDDVVITYSSSSVTLTNVSQNGTDIETITILPTSNKIEFWHNGVKWTYSASGNVITLEGKVRGYKLVEGDNKYLAYFSTHGQTSGQGPWWYPSYTETRVYLYIPIK